MSYKKEGKIIRLESSVWDWLKKLAEKETSGNVTKMIEKLLTEIKIYREIKK